MRPAAALAVCWLIALGGCASAVEVRIQNASQLDFRDVTFAGEPYGDIEVGETTDYREVKLKFRYAVMKMTVDGRHVNAQSLNLRSRRFTHRVRIKDLEAGHLAVQVIREPR